MKYILGLSILVILLQSEADAQWGALNWLNWENPTPEQCAGLHSPACWDACEATNWEHPACVDKDPTREGPTIRCPWRCSADAGGMWGMGSERYTDELCEGYAGDNYLHVSSSSTFYNVVMFCRHKGYFTNIDFNGAGFPGHWRYGGGTVTFQVGGIEEEIEELELDGCNEGRVCFRSKSSGEFTQTMNSPFIYFENLEDGEYQVRITSYSDAYETDPEFNAEAGWDVEVENEELRVKKEEIDYLFYELETPRISLSRDGKSFAGREALVNYLETSGFFDHIGMDAQQAVNSLGYVLDNLPNMPYYYLTILNSESIASLSRLSVTDSDGNKVNTERKYFAIYPSRIPVQTSGKIDFPKNIPVDGPLVREYGEVIIKPHMHILWR